MTITNRPSPLALVPPSPAGNPGRMVPLPASLPKSLLHEWREVVQLLTAQGKWTDQRASLLEAYFGNLLILREAVRQINVAGAFAPDGKPNPASAIVARHSPVLAKLAGSLGLVVGEAVTPEVPSATKASAWTA